MGGAFVVGRRARCEGVVGGGAVVVVGIEVLGCGRGRGRVGLCCCGGRAAGAVAAGRVAVGLV